MNFDVPTIPCAICGEPLGRRPFAWATVKVEGKTLDLGLRHTQCPAPPVVDRFLPIVEEGGGT